jgi:hypothetical protein
MYARFIGGTVWRIQPTRKSTDEIWRVMRRPNDSSDAHDAAAPKNAAAWKHDVMLDETLAYAVEESLSRPKYSAGRQRGKRQGGAGSTRV